MLIQAALWGSVSQRGHSAHIGQFRRQLVLIRRIRQDLEVGKTSGRVATVKSHPLSADVPSSQEAIEHSVPGPAPCCHRSEGRGGTKAQAKDRRVTKAPTNWPRISTEWWLEAATSGNASTRKTIGWCAATSSARNALGIHAHKSIDCGKTGIGVQLLQMCGSIPRLRTGSPSV